MTHRCFSLPIATSISTVAMEDRRFHWYARDLHGFCTKCESLCTLSVEKRHFEQAARVDRLPSTLCSATQAHCLPIRGIEESAGQNLSEYLSHQLQSHFYILRMLNWAFATTKLIRVGRNDFGVGKTYRIIIALK